MFFVYQIVAFIVGVLSCWGFWMILLRVKPDLHVGPSAAFNEAQGKLGFKIANFGKKQIVDIHMRVAVLHRSPNGKVLTLLAGHLKTNSIAALDPQQNLDVPWSLPTTFIVVRSNGAELVRRLSAPCSDGEHRIAFTVLARHSLSGRVLAQRTIYSDRDIKRGWFDRGLVFSISETAISKNRDSTCVAGEAENGDLTA